MKKKVIVFAICLGLWTIILWMTSQTMAASDGYDAIGFPLVFYRQFYGKGDYEGLNLGINYTNLIIDVLLVFLVAWIVIRLLKNRQH